MPRLRSRSGNKAGISEIVASLIMVAVTLIGGVAVFGFVNSQAGTSERQYAGTVAANVNNLDEHFSVVNIQFGSSCVSGSNPPLDQIGGTCGQALIFVYNTGSVSLDVQAITITGPTSSVGGVPLDVVASQTGTVDYPTTLGCSTSQFTYTYATTTVVAGITSTVTTSDIGIISQPIPSSLVPPAVFTVVLPGGPCPIFVAGASYQVQVQGIYGNIANFQITASG
jgi:flagellin-like protein